MFDSKLSIAIDAYQSETRDLLLNVTVPATSGFTSALQNIGKIRNRGLEIMLSTNQSFACGLNWEGSFAFSTNKNKVLALGPGQEQILFRSGLNDDSYIVQVGESLGSFYGYKVNGIFTSQEQFDTTPHLEGQKQGVGDFIYADINGDNKVDANDRTIIGNANPDFTWGLNNTFRWKDIDFGFGLEGKHGGKIFNATTGTWLKHGVTTSKSMARTRLPAAYGLTEPRAIPDHPHGMSKTHHLLESAVYP